MHNTIFHQNIIIVVADCIYFDTSTNTCKGSTQKQRDIFVAETMVELRIQLLPTVVCSRAYNATR